MRRSPGVAVDEADERVQVGVLCPSTATICVAGLRPARWAGLWPL